jgi:hypothetical protein
MQQNICYCRDNHYSIYITLRAVIRSPADKANEYYRYLILHCMDTRLISPSTSRTEAVVGLNEVCPASYLFLIRSAVFEDVCNVQFELRLKLR